jgi:hypothetical protein
MYRILEGDVMEMLRTLPDESVQCCITSPPYWGLRDYGLAPSVWFGAGREAHATAGREAGATACEHEWVTEEVVKPCILAGTSEKGCCPQCGAPWRRPTFRACPKCGASIATQADECGACGYVNDWKDGRIVSEEMRATDFHTPGLGVPRFPGNFHDKKIAGEWTAGCKCAELASQGDSPVPKCEGPGAPVSPYSLVPSPCVVLDCFAGSGTCGVVALRHGRDFIGIELNAKYAEMARRRIESDQPLFNKAAISS